MVIHRWLFDIAERSRYFYLDLADDDNRKLYAFPVGWLGHIVLMYYVTLPECDIVSRFLSDESLKK